MASNYNYKKIKEANGDIFMYYRYFCGTKSEDLILEELSKVYKASYLDLIKEIENTKPIETGLYVEREEYRNKDRYSKDYKEQIERTFYPKKNKIKIEHGLQRHITENKERYRKIIGIPVYYEFPLFKRAVNSNCQTGAIDIISYIPEENTLLLIELKKIKGGIKNKSGYYAGTDETFIRAYAEVSTYYSFFKELYQKSKKGQAEKFKETLETRIKEEVSTFDENKYNTLKIKKAIMGPDYMFKTKFANDIKDCECYKMQTLVDDLDEVKVGEKKKEIFSIEKCKSLFI